VAKPVGRLRYAELGEFSHASRGNIAFDAQIAAVCREHRVTRLLTLDRDFSRFSGPALMSPLDPID
jgi:predicted nucleic acid-binding protein